MKSPNSIKQVTIDSVTYDLPYNSNIEFKKNSHKQNKETIATTIKNILKIKIKEDNTYTVPLIVEDQEDRIKELDKRKEEVTLSVALHDDSLYWNIGRVNIENYESKNIILVKISPIGSWKTLNT